jgi:UPF0755 protein
VTGARRRRRNVRRALLVLVALPVVGVLAFGVWLRWSYPYQPGPGRGAEVEIDLPWGGGPAVVARRVAAAGVVESERFFAWYLRLAGRASRLGAGRHTVRDDWSPAEVAAALARPGREAQVRVTLREGLTRFEMADLLEREGVTTATGFLRATTDRALLERLGVAADSAEGYLFPETYQMVPGTAPARIVARLVETARVRHASVLGSRRAAVEALGREMVDLERAVGRGPFGARLDHIDPSSAGRHAAIVIASLVEAETPVEAERPRVAAVAFNRLRSPTFPSRRVQFDPTVAYGCVAEPSRAPSCAGGADVLLARHLADAANRYNTYQHPGLPPGPIGNPSISSLRAALEPAAVDDLYFVADGRGGHVFSKTLDEHNAAVARYRATLGPRDAGAGP